MKLLQQQTEKRSRIPVATLCITAISLLLALSSDLSLLLQYDRDAMASGQLWRVITGHWVHWSFDHLLWCTITFLVLGYVCEMISPRGYLATLVAAGVIIPTLLWVAEPGMQVYRGLSGLASAVFVYAAMLLAHSAFTTKDWSRFVFYVLAGGGYVGKILYEFICGQAVFVERTELFSPVPVAHLAGGAVGVALFCIVLFNTQFKVKKVHIS